MDVMGQMLANRYRVTGLLGRGGMGAVWRAHDERLDREVAIKELYLPHHLDDEQRHTWIARLDREARAAARLNHPGIITVHDHFTDGDRPWVVMELVKGPSLEAVLEEHGRLAPDEVARIGLRMLDALDAAHRAGIVHRDVKPANVLMEGDRVVLTDFGIAAVEGDVTLTRPGSVMGTPAFMSPEQVAGQGATAASDLWSLGATLHNAVEGSTPFDGPSMAVVLVAIATRPPAPASHAGRLAPVLDALLRKNPAERPSADQLRSMLNGSPAPVPAPTAPQRLSPTRRKRSKRGPLIAASLLAMAVITAGLWYVGDVDPAYEANLRAADKLTASAYKRVSSEKLGESRARVTYEICSGLSCDPQNEVGLVTDQIEKKAEIFALGEYDSKNCATPNGCGLDAETRTPPHIRDLRFFTTEQKQFRLRFEIG